VAQALHWFDFERFWQEIQRVAKPNALFCAWGYSWFDCDSKVLSEFVLPIRKLIEPLNKYIQTWSAYKFASNDKAIAEEIQSISSYALLKFQDKGNIDFNMPLTSIAGFVNPT